MIRGPILQVKACHFARRMMDRSLKVESGMYLSGLYLGKFINPGSRIRSVFPASDTVLFHQAVKTGA